MIKIAKDDISKEVEELKAKGHTVYSISRLNTFSECKYAYYLGYIKKVKGKDNCYNIMGSDIHDVMEDWYNDKCDKSSLKKVYSSSLIKLSLLNIKFPNKLIEDNWKADMLHFVENVSKIDGNFLTEKGFVADINGNYIQGFIDAISIKDDSLVIYDWKTSGEFKKDKLLKAGRQLLLYKLALEQITDFKVSNMYWFMTKYVFVHYGNRRKMCSRRKWVKDISNLLKTALKKLGYEEFIYEIMIQNAIEKNSLEDMPNEIRDMYKVSDCILEYEATKELIDECRAYITNTIAEIESMDKSDEEQWTCCDIDENEFFCDNLCSYSNHCKHYQDWIL